MNVYGYARLSRDEDRENYTSIMVQDDIIKDYASMKGWEVTKTFVDDNYSGYILERPAFEELLNTVVSNDVILVKDLSRFGRNNGKVLVLLDYLRMNKIRLISITEANGGLDLLKDDYDMLGIKTWFNEMYVKDISRKIKANIHSKQKRGEIILSNFYGYKKEKQGNYYTLIIDETIKPVIQMIYQRYIDGMGYKRICDVMDQYGFITPSEYEKKRLKAIGKISKKKICTSWRTDMVQRILQNDLYCGTLRTRKTQSSVIKGPQERLDKTYHYIFEDHHEAMVTKEDYALVQNIMAKRQKHYRYSNTKYPYIFSGFMICATCKNAIVGKVAKKKKEQLRGYNCTMYIKYGNKHCYNHFIVEEDILRSFRLFIKELLSSYNDLLNCLKVEKKEVLPQAFNRLNKEIENIQREYLQIIQHKINAVEKAKDKAHTKIIEDAYTTLEQEKEREIIQLKSQVKIIKASDSSRDMHRSYKKALEECSKENKPIKRKVLEQLLERIEVESGSSIIYFLKADISQLVTKN